MQLGLMAG